MVIGGLLNVFGVPAVQMLIASAVVNGVLAPVLIWFIVRLADHPDVIGEFHSTRTIRVLGWITFWVMGVAAIAFLADIVGIL